MTGAACRQEGGGGIREGTSVEHHFSLPGESVGYCARVGILCLGGKPWQSLGERRREE